MKIKIATTFLALISLLSSFLPKSSFAASYDLTQDTTGTVPFYGTFYLQNNGSFQVFQNGNTNLVTFGPNMNVTSTKDLGLTVNVLAKLNGNRLLVSHGANNWGILDYTTGLMLKTGNLLTSINNVPTDGAQFPNGNLLFFNNNSPLKLADKDMNLLTTIYDPTYTQTVGMTISPNGFAYAVRTTNGGQTQSELIKLSDDGTIIDRTDIPFISFVFILALDNGNIAMFGTNELRVYDSNLQNLYSGPIDSGFGTVASAPGYYPFDLGDGNLVVMGIKNGHMVYNVMNYSNGSVMKSVINDSLLSIKRLARGKLITINGDLSYQVFIGPTGVPTSTLSPEPVPYDLRNTGSSTNPIITWNVGDPAKIDHYEIYVDDQIVTSSLYQTTYQPSLSSGTHKIQVVAVDTNGKKTSLSSPLVITTATAPVGSNSNITISSGNLSTSYLPINFSALTVGNSGAMSSTASTTISIVDSRGTGAGWSYNLAISDFIATVTDKSIASGTMDVVIPASSVSVSIGAPSLIAGQSINPLYGPSSNSGGVLGNTASPLINTSPGFGMGQYSVPLNFTLNIPNTLKVKSLSNAGSKYVVNDNVGVFAGNYTSTFTFTSGVGL